MVKFLNFIFSLFVIGSTGLFSSPLSVVKKHLEDHGKGELAIELLGKKDILIDKLVDQAAGSQETLHVLEKTALSAQATANAMDKVVGATQQVVAAVDVNAGAVNAQTEVIQQGVNHLEKLKTAAQVVTVVGSAATIVTHGYSFYNFLQSSLWPTQEQTLAHEMSKEKLAEDAEILKTKRILNKCLVRNAQCPKDSMGMPIACQNESKAFADAAGYEALNRMNAAFNARVH